MFDFKPELTLFKNGWPDSMSFKLCGPQGGSPGRLLSGPRRWNVEAVFVEKGLGCAE